MNVIRINGKPYMRPPVGDTYVMLLLYVFNVFTFHRLVVQQLDVLELLVQNGADVNAKTKNGETPYDICEDPELKERIIQLKSELETKKASHPNRLKRSHSQNTRSHSVRRTSIREKSQIAKREVIKLIKNDHKIWEITVI
jgi:hypothetical protein